MEEKKKQEQPKKLSYEELAQHYSELSYQHQRLTEEYRKVMTALQSRDFDYTSFFMSMLFKVMDHPEMYNDEFVQWAGKHIEDAMYSFEKAMMSQGTQEKSDEAE